MNIKKKRRNAVRMFLNNVEGKDWRLFIRHDYNHANGLTLDADRTPEWHNAKKMYSIYWDAYRRVNKQLSKVRKAIGHEAINGKRVTIYQYL